MRLINAEHVTTATVVPTMLDRIVTVLRDRRPSSCRRCATWPTAARRWACRWCAGRCELLAGCGLRQRLRPDRDELDDRGADPRRPSRGAGGVIVVGRRRRQAVGLGRTAGARHRAADPRRGRHGAAARARPASCSCAASRSPAATPGSGRCSTRTAGSQPRTSPRSTRTATCSSADAATTPSSAAARTSRPPSWRRC